MCHKAGNGYLWEVIEMIMNTFFFFVINVPFLKHKYVVFIVIKYPLFLFL